MALQKTVQFRGITVPNAYIRVGFVEVTKNRLVYGLTMHAAADTEQFDSRSVAADYDLDGENPLRQAYAHAKTMPEFDGAEDV